MVLASAFLALDGFLDGSGLRLDLSQSFGLLNRNTELIPDLRLKGFRDTVSAYRVHFRNDEAPADPTTRQIASVSDTNREA